MKTNLKTWLVVSMFLLAIGSVVNAKTIYVDADRPPGGGGTNWVDAYKYLQDALADADASAKPVEIRVAQGTYKPDEGSGVTDGLRTETFQLINGVTLKGGFAGDGELDPNARDTVAYESILSGDLDGNDGPNFADNNENSYHVVTGSGTGETTVLNGFTITGGNANGSYPDNNGGGMYNKWTYNNLIVTNCTFVRNLADNSGGGIYNYYFCDLMISDCTFRNNSAGYDGGAIFNWLSNPILVNCIFIGSSAGKDGGGIFNNHGGSTLTNCTLIGNSARNYGGGMYSVKVHGDSVLINCIIWGNIADEGPQIGIGEIFMGGGVTFVSYCDIQGGRLDVYDPCEMLDWGAGNIDVDPCFLDADGADNTAGTEDDNLHLLADSACIDAGDNTAIPADVNKDLDGNPRIINSIVDMGAYEVRPVIYVDADAAGNNDGTSWVDAYNYLQDGLAAATGGWGEILVAQGTYEADQGNGITAGDRVATFQLINGITLKGGYAGDGEPNPNARDVSLYETTLSGDLAGDDGPDFANNSENSQHVLTGGDIGGTAVLEGFTVSGGNANKFPTHWGGGMYNETGGLILISCTFSGNSAWNGGGGIYNDVGNLTLTDCTFSGNRSTSTRGGGISNGKGNMMVTNCLFNENVAASWAGGIYNYIGDATLTNCTFNNNSCIYDGGGVFNARGDIMLTNCRFNGNSAQHGGGVGSDYGSLSLINCVLSGNSASNWGGGMFNSHFGAVAINCIFSGNSADDGGGIATLWLHLGDLMLTNCTFSGNSATDYGGAVFNNGYLDYESDLMLSNCILWGNTAGGEGPEIAMKNNGTVSISYSCLQGGQLDVYVPEATLDWNDITNIDIDPCFVDADGADDITGTEADDLHLLWNSACINAGDPGGDYTGQVDIDGELRVMVGRVDMGADETSEKQADFTRDGRIDLEDLDVFVQSWLSSSAETDWYILCDLKEDDQIDFKDYADFAADYLWQAGWYEP